MNIIKYKLLNLRTRTSKRITHNHNGIGWGNIWRGIQINTDPNKIRRIIVNLQNKMFGR